MGGGLNYIGVLTGYASAYADLRQNYIIIWQADDIKKKKTSKFCFIFIHETVL